MTKTATKPTQPQPTVVAHSQAQPQQATTALANTPKALTSLLPVPMANLARAIDGVVGNYAAAIQQAEGHFEKAFLLANGITSLRAAITPEAMVPILALMNTPNGFMTDRGTRKSPTPYPAEQVKECLITALLEGVYPVGNHFNIIADRCYITQQGYKHKLQTLPGITDINVVPGTATVADGRVTMRIAISWKLNGLVNQLLNQEQKPGSVFSAMGGIDQASGKCLRKALKAAFEKATGSEHTSGDEDDLPEGNLAGPANAATAALPGTRSEQVLGHLDTARPRVETASPEQRGQIESLTTQLQFNATEFADLCSRLGVPPVPSQMTPAQATVVIEDLEWQVRDHEEERAAIHEEG